MPIFLARVRSRPGAWLSGPCSGVPRERFWQRMTYHGIWAWAAGRTSTSGPSRRIRVRPWHALAGLGLGGSTAATCTFPRSAIGSPGARCARRRHPHPRHLRAAARSDRGPRSRAAWPSLWGRRRRSSGRRLVQSALMRRLRSVAQARVVATLTYGGVVTWPLAIFTLIGAARGRGSALVRPVRSARVPLGALVVSHVAWDIWIFLIQPTGEIEAIGPDGRSRAGVVSEDAATLSAARAGGRPCYER